MKGQNRDSWYLGYQEGFDSGWDKGYEEGIEEGIHEGFQRGKGRVEFLKVKCSCGAVLPFPVFVGVFSRELKIKEAGLVCPKCIKPVARTKVLQAFSRHNTLDKDGKH